MDIEEDQVRELSPGEIETGSPVGCLDYLITLGLEQIPEQFHIEWIVLDNENAVAAIGCVFM
jgi:hypothetical protein